MVYQLEMARLWSIQGPRTSLIGRKCCIFNGEKDYVFGLWSVRDLFLWIFDSFQIFSANTRVYAGKLLNMLYQLLMAMFWSILGPNTNLIDGKCYKFNGEMGNVLSLGLKT
jgi:hypothetical protein